MTVSDRSREDTLKRIVRTFQTSSGLEQRLHLIAGIVAEQSGAECACIFLADSSGRLLRSGGASRPQCTLQQKIVGQHHQSVSSSDSRFFRGTDKCGLNRTITTSILRKNRVQGVLIINFGENTVIPDETRDFAATVAGVLSDLLRFHRSHQLVQKKHETADALLRISSRLGYCRTEEEYLAGITKAAAELTDSRGAVLRLKVGDSLPVWSFFTSSPNWLDEINSPNDLVVADEVVKVNRAVIVNNISERESDETGCGPIKENSLSVPVYDGDEISGVLTVFDRAEDEFHRVLPYTREEREAVFALLKIGSLALARVRDGVKVSEISQSLENRVRELSILHYISRVALTTEETGDVLRSLLAAITHMEGLGFDRAFLFLLDGDDKILKGIMGLEVAGRAGGGARMGLRTPFARIGESDLEEKHIALDDTIRELTIPVDKKSGVLARTVLEKKFFLVRLPRDHELIDTEVVEKMGGVNSFATVPLVSGEKVLGVIWVDNIHTSRPIIMDDCQLLVSAGAQAGLTVRRALRAQAIESMKGQLVDLQERLMQWEKMAVLGEMAATVAHEIRNPLVSIGGFTQRLRKMLPDDNAGMKYAEIIIREVARLERTLEDVMSFTRGYVNIDKESISIEDLLGECVDLFRENFRRKRVVLQQKIADGIPPIHVDQRQLKQAIINILINAGQAVSEGGEVILGALMPDDRKMNLVEISIADNGGGISPENMDNIFQPFFSTKATGTGLGLTIAQRAISGHNGELRVDNRPGEGVTFTMLLPLKDSDIKNKEET
ncbi:GAF domain-containing protein [bacterium]|nr:MAG: GAF domain-containing protein [bacterium]